MYTNIDIPSEVASELFRRAPQREECSALLEKILKEYFEAHPVSGREELDLINQNADELNREATDVLDFQIIP